MSLVSSHNDYTEEELLRVCEEIGLPVDSASINILKTVIDELFAESVSDNETDATDTSLFASLSLSDSAERSGETFERNGGMMASPIRQSRKRLSKPTHRSHCHSTEVPLDVPSSQENEEMKHHNPTAYFLLNDAWRCLNSVYGTMKAIENLQTKLVSFGRPGCATYLNKAVLKSPVKHSGENKENQDVTTSCRGGIRSLLCAKPFEPYRRVKTPFETIPEETSDDIVYPDPCLRRVNQVAPGQLFYRHDPVKKFELYREEWARRPAPGEQKRLALRWKVREYMLRQDLTRFDPTKRIARYAVHPKDWSPKPYLS